MMLRMGRRLTRNERRQGRGISLLPALWARIDGMAEAQSKSRSEVVEEFLTPLLSLGDDLQRVERSRWRDGSGE